MRTPTAQAAEKSTLTVHTENGQTANAFFAVLPANWSERKCDLFVLSGIGYYVSSAALPEMVGPLNGADVHLIPRANKRLVWASAYVEDDFMLDFFRSTALT